MILWLNPVSGVSGDMLLGALIELGAPLGEVRAAVSSTGLTGWELETRTVSRAGLVATQAVVTVTDEQTERRAAELLERVGRARPEPVARLAIDAVRAIAEVEAGLHGEHPDRVHLHEIGGLDTVVDTVGVAAALHLLGIDQVYCGPLALGTGTVRTRHGILPLPAPATAALLARAGAEVTDAGRPGETVTPTGAALLLAAGARFGGVPRMTVHAVGHGAGSREVPGRPNVLPAMLGAPAAGGSSSPARAGDPGTVERMVLLETNVDDVTGELLGHLIGRLLAAGAADAWCTPIVMKKGRPAHTVHALAEPGRMGECERVLLAETGSLGVRRSSVDRLALPREIVTVSVDGHPVRVKRGPWGAKPEHDDLVAAASALNLPLREVSERARRASPERPPDPAQADPAQADPAQPDPGPS
ncbi:MAG TPA: nickel pincer cofactor biosynthesis protein LarC [Pseudonocardia sp.]|nr:nickel pincer cofactor biosynthesis protein LarC [Pseudonocardia sp.]